MIPRLLFRSPLLISIDGQTFLVLYIYIYVCMYSRVSMENVLSRDRFDEEENLSLALSS